MKPPPLGMMRLSLSVKLRCALSGGGFGFQLRLGRADALQAALLVGHPVRGLVATAIRPVLCILRGVSGHRLIQPGLHLGHQLRLLAHHVLVAHCLVPAGVGAQLGAVDRNVPQLDQTRGPTQPQNLHEQFRQRCQMPLAEVTDGAEVRPVQPGDRHHVHPLFAGACQLTAGVDAAAVAIQQQCHQHTGMVGRLALLTLVDAHDRRQVQRLAHRVPHEMRQVPRRHKLTHRRRQQPCLIHVPRAKALAHAPH
jgi:hypothetical protein